MTDHAIYCREGSQWHVPFISHRNLYCCYSFPPRFVKSLASSHSTGDTCFLLTEELVAHSAGTGHPFLREYGRSSTYHLRKILLDVWKSWVNFFFLLKEINKLLYKHWRMREFWIPLNLFGVFSFSIISIVGEKKTPKLIHPKTVALKKVFAWGQNMVIKAELKFLHDLKLGYSWTKCNMLSINFILS